MATQVHVRQDVWALETAHDTWDPISLAYARAVGEMQRRPSTDPTSWSYQAAIHGTYARVPRGADWNVCQHASWFFPPWHRMYLYWFERIVRSIVVEQGGPADWALPYWNYSKGFPDNTLPPAFRERALPDGSPNPLFVQARNQRPRPGINGGAQLPPRATSYAYAFQFEDYIGDQTQGFGGGRSPAVQFDHATGALENQPHNIIHDLVGGATSGQCGGGLMSDPLCAARDPIFWLHHSNIDRLWSLWIAQGGRRANPTDRSWLDQPFTFHDERGGEVQMHVSDVLTVEQLGYRYDDQPPMVARRIRRPVAAARMGGEESVADLVAASQGGVELSGQPATVDIPLDAPGREAVSGITESVEPANVYLNVEGVEADENPGVVYEIYVDLPEGEEAPVDDDAHFVGHVTFFSAKHARGPGDHDVAGGLRHTFDITALVQELQARGLWRDDRVRVTFVPLGLLPPPGQEAVPEAAMEPEERAVPTARIGRVSLVRG